MTANERLEKLLNRAGQTISDLPTNYGDSAETLSPAFDAAYAWFDAHCLTWTGETAQYILHLTDVIDRMETALENLLNERDWMIREMRDIGFCDTCYFHRFSTELTSTPECEDCDPNSRETIMYCYGGVPEDWRADE